MESKTSIFVLDNIEYKNEYSYEMYKIWFFIFLQEYIMLKVKNIFIEYPRHGIYKNIRNF